MALNDLRFVRMLQKDKNCDPHEEMRKLGITYTHSSVGKYDLGEYMNEYPRIWYFWNCKNIPDKNKLPNFLGFHEKYPLHEYPTELLPKKAKEVMAVKLRTLMEGLNGYQKYRAYLFLEELYKENNK